jgi:hypothetical protein
MGCKGLEVSAVCIMNLTALFLSLCYALLGLILCLTSTCHGVRLARPGRWRVDYTLPLYFFRWAATSGLSRKEKCPVAPHLLALHSVHSECSILQDTHHGATAYHPPRDTPTRATCFVPLHVLPSPRDSRVDGASSKLETLAQANNLWHHQITQPFLAAGVPGSVSVHRAQGHVAPLGADLERCPRRGWDA